MYMIRDFKENRLVILEWDLPLPPCYRMANDVIFLYVTEKLHAIFIFLPLSFNSVIRLHFFLFLGCN